MHAGTVPSAQPVLVCLYFSKEVMKPKGSDSQLLFHVTVPFLLWSGATASFTVTWLCVICPVQDSTLCPLIHRPTTTLSNSTAPARLWCPSVLLWKTQLRTAKRGREPSCLQVWTTATSPPVLCYRCRITVFFQILTVSPPSHVEFEMQVSVTFKKSTACFSLRRALIKQQDFLPRDSSSLSSTNIK